MTSEGGVTMLQISSSVLPSRMSVRPLDFSSTSCIGNPNHICDTISMFTIGILCLERICELSISCNVL